MIQVTISSILTHVVSYLGGKEGFRKKKCGEILSENFPNLMKRIKM